MTGRHTLSVVDTCEYYDDEPEYEPEEVERPRDTKIDEAKEALLRDLFKAEPDRVFYVRQIEVMFERKFYHWIAARALSELEEEGKIRSEKMAVREGLEVRFYRSPKNRYWKQQANRIAKLVGQYSSEPVGRALGQHGELMFDAALPKAGFMPVAWDVRGYKGREWTRSEHDLDRIFERDGVGYGTEVKNALDYIDREELEIKLEMCAELGMKPLFIMRYAPKSYNDMIIRAGGFALIFEWQMYPPGYEELAQRLKEELGLKVGWPRSVAEGTVGRFLKWHVQQVGGGVR